MREKTLFDYFIIDTETETVKGQGRIIARDVTEACILINPTAYIEGIKSGKIVVRLNIIANNI